MLILRRPWWYTVLSGSTPERTKQALRTRWSMALIPDMGARMCDAVVDAAAPAEAGERFVQLVAEVGVRHRQLRSARLCPPALHDSLQPGFHRICRQVMLLGCFIEHQ